MNEKSSQRNCKEIKIEIKKIQIAEDLIKAGIFAGCAYTTKGRAIPCSMELNKIIFPYVTMPLEAAKYEQYLEYYHEKCDEKDDKKPQKAIRNHFKALQKNISSVQEVQTAVNQPMTYVFAPNIECSADPYEVAAMVEKHARMFFDMVKEAQQRA